LLLSSCVRAGSKEIYYASISSVKIYQAPHISTAGVWNRS
jgi:hypothetical protein